MRLILLYPHSTNRLLEATLIQHRADKASEWWKCFKPTACPRAVAYQIHDVIF